MRSLPAFLKKELLEQYRSGKVMLLGLLFVLLGIMNPAIAKLTPWLLETMADSLAESGMVVTGVTVSAMDSWVQFYKNLPIGLIAFILVESSIFTREYQTGTLILALTKGLSRYKVVISKTVVLTGLWTLGYWLCFGVTYIYNAYFWDNAVASHLLFSAGCWWGFGLWVIMLAVLFSVASQTNTGVLTGTGGVVLVSYLLGFFPKVKSYLPTALSDGNSLIYGVTKPGDYLWPLAVAAVMAVTCFAVSIPVFAKKKLS